MDLVVDFGRDFVKVPRSVINTLAKYPLALAVYLVLLGRARYAPGLGQLGHGFVDLEIGEAVAGRADLAVACATSENKVRTALDHLQRLRLITVHATNRGSKITICGYAESFAPSADESPAGPPARPPATAPADHQQITSQTTTNKISRSEIRDRDLVEARKPPRSRGHRFAPSDWLPKPEDALLPPDQLDREIAKFRDHEFASAKSNWDRTWRNWQRNVLDRSPVARAGRIEPHAATAYPEGRQEL